MGHTVRTHSATPRQRPTFYEVQNTRARILAQAEQESWGRYRSDQLLGNEVFMYFERGQASYRLPADAHYPDKKGTK